MEVLVIVPCVDISIFVTQVQQFLDRSAQGSVRLVCHRHPMNDNGVFHHGDAFAREKRQSETHVLALFDFSGSGAKSPAKAAEDRLSDRLAKVTFGSGHTHCVAFEPTIEDVYFSQPDIMAHYLGLGGSYPNLKAEAERRFQQDLYKQMRFLIAEANKNVKAKKNQDRRDFSAIIESIPIERLSAHEKVARLIGVISDWQAAHT